jgi:cupin 2 domain-containing protein
MKNLFKNIPVDLPEELFETLVDNENIQIKRIVSKGHTSPKEGWYDQERNEFVLVLKGAARLEFEDGRMVSMTVGDYLEVPAHVKHKVAWTDPNEETVWLAVHHP